MSATPAHNLQDTAARTVTVAAEAVVTARRGFPRAVAHAKKYGVDDQAIRQLCADVGLDWADVRALLDEEVEA